MAGIFECVNDLIDKSLRVMPVYQVQLLAFSPNPTAAI